MSGEVVSLLAAFPGATWAIARVLGGAGGAGAAWLDIVRAEGQRRATSIRDETVARSAVMKKLATAAAQQVGKDPERMERAITVLLGKQYQAQENVEATCVKATQFLSEDPPQAGSTETPEEDWFNVFIPYVEKASSENLRSTWARVLAGEIRKPGSYSLRTLQFVSLLDRELAECVQESSRFLIGGSVIPTIGPYAKGDKFTRLLSLSGVGLLNLGLSYYVESPVNAEMMLPVADSHILCGQVLGGQQYHITGALLTQMGKEVFSLVESDADLGACELYKPHLSQIFGSEVRLRPVSEVPFFTKEDKLAKAFPGRLPG